MIDARDPFGLPIRVQQPGSAVAVAGFVEGFLGYTPRILEVLAVAEADHSLIVQACAAALQMFAESGGAPAAARPHLERAARAARPSTERERQFAAAVKLWVDGDAAAALVAHEAALARWPRDLCTLKLAQYHAFNLGDSPALLRLALRALPAAHDVAWLHGMLAFGWEQCHRLDEAEHAARLALALRPAEPWAQHALAHVMLSDGRLAEGAAFLRAASGQWRGLTSFMRTHNWWHLALFLIELGDAAGALALYDQEVWGIDKSYSQDQVGAVSLLARLELAGLDVGPRWQELASWLERRLDDRVQPFLDLQYLYGLARAGRPQAAALLARIEADAPNAPTATLAAWQRVALPAARGLLAHAQGRWVDAADALEQALPRLTAIGGSHAQRELFEQIHIDALQRSGQHAGVLNALQPRARAQPQSMRLKRQLRGSCAALGLPIPG
ncbi:tetratricopeptide repeat protein [Aquincola sp. S2]|uniref:Tetratricopeptide repeat protein 38 n=1 Tax=Pseudaquabacterium terrae TaxID=2732868 RepID=A0ABX2EUK7_9BURK|nr:tetratricopeptide repeat protein [Aquabacterium terrae]NRF72346.1 tetratricopeptide repeat protein [Aquabacterium terrae]